MQEMPEEEQSALAECRRPPSRARQGRRQPQPRRAPRSIPGQDPDADSAMSSGTSTENDNSDDDSEEEEDSDDDDSDNDSTAKQMAVEEDFTAGSQLGDVESEELEPVRCPRRDVCSDTFVYPTFRRNASGETTNALCSHLRGPQHSLTKDEAWSVILNEMTWLMPATNPGTGNSRQAAMACPRTQQDRCLHSFLRPPGTTRSQLRRAVRVHLQHQPHSLSEEMARTEALRVLPHQQRGEKYQERVRQVILRQQKLRELESGQLSEEEETERKQWVYEYYCRSFGPRISRWSEVEMDWNVFTWSLRCE